LTKDEIDQMRSDPRKCAVMPSQEPGVRRSCPLPYELSCDGKFTADGRGFSIRFAAGNKQFGEQAAGAPFMVYWYNRGNDVRVRNYAVAAGGELDDSWTLEDPNYRLCAYGPNGFFRSWQGGEARVEASIETGRSLSNIAARTGQLFVRLVDQDALSRRAVTVQNAYSGESERTILEAGKPVEVAIHTVDTFGWYDFTIRVEGDEMFEIRYAGRVETGGWSYSDPAMGSSILSATRVGGS
jgi:phospholipase C